MKSLLEFLLESIGYSELSKIVDFELMENWRDAEKIIEDHNGKKELGYRHIDTLIAFANPLAKHYKINVNGICVGVFSFIYGKDMIGTVDRDYFEAFVLPFAIERNGGTDSPIDKKVFMDIAKDTMYVSLLFLFKEEKNLADLAPTAAIKVVFDKVKSLAKDGGCPYILAGGKDERTTRMYQVAGGFKKMTGYPSYKDYRDMVPHPMDENYDGDGTYKGIVDAMVYYEL